MNGTEKPANSVHRMCLEIQQGESRATQQLWQEFFDRLVVFASRKLRGTPRAMSDEEDIALSALKSLCLGLQRGKISAIDNRESLWRLLLVITSRKVIDVANYHRRDKRNHQRLAQPQSSQTADQMLGNLVSCEPSPEIAAEITDSIRTALDALVQPELKQVAEWKLLGWTNQEIAERLGRSLSTVERKLRTIRAIWGQFDDLAP